VEVKGVAWIGTRTDRFDAMLAFARDVLGLKVTTSRQDFAVLKLPDGDRMEIFGPSDQEHVFMRCPLAEFRVDDVRAARAEMEGKGVPFIGPIHSQSGVTWTHFIAPDGHVYGITSG
jgi:hypothetical protein